MQNKSAASLRKRRRKLLAELPPLDRIMRGSLIERYKRCGRPGCHCANERGHGPKLYLSVSIPGGRPQMDYVPNARGAEVSELIGNFNKVREILNEVSAINIELLRRREELG
jgi:uncharacterized protein DUF6788